eukprot:SAG22_NODE_214_length_15003_cov_18.466519_2_plen_43_part_00
MVLRSLGRLALVTADSLMDDNLQKKCADSLMVQLQTQLETDG